MAKIKVDLNKQRRRLSTLVNPVTLFRKLTDKELVVNHSKWQVLLFLVVGGICAIVDISLLALFVEVLSLSITMAFLLAVTISTTLNYYLNVKFVFVAGKHNRKLEATYFFLNSLLALGLNYLIMWVLIEVFSVWYIVSRSVALVTVSAVNFVLRKYLIFQK